MWTRRCKNVSNNPTLVVLVALIAVSIVLSACGKSGKGEDLGSNQANSLLVHLDALNALTLPDQCDQALSEADALAARVSALSVSVREDLRGALADSSDNLRTLVLQQCSGATTTTQTQTSTTQTQTTKTSTGTVPTEPTTTTTPDTTPQTQPKPPTTTPGGGGHQTNTNGSGGVGAGTRQVKP